MSQVIIRKILENRLSTIASPLPTAYENTSYVPVTGTPFQYVTLLPATPDNNTIGDSHYLEQGLLQVTLCYPKNNGANAAQARAEAIKAHFTRGLGLSDSGLTLTITRTPNIKPSYVENAFYCIPITIQYHMHI